MARRSVITQKRRGPTPTGKGTLIGVRIQPNGLRRLDAWVKEQDDVPSRPEALRRLAELGLAASASTRPHSAKTRAKAADMAHDVLDRHADQMATPEEQASRKRRLLKGPKEFRDLRKDHK